MNKLYLKLILLITFCFSITSINSQWRYPEVTKLTDDVVVTYKVEYDEPLSEEQKQSYNYKKEIVVYFNNDFLVEKTFTGKTGYIKKMIINYNQGKFYTGYNKRLIEHDLKPGKKATTLEKGVKESILDISCDVYTKSTSTKKILSTKKFGIRYSKNYKCEGFLLKYMGRDIKLGSYTVTATKIESSTLPENLYNLDNYSIKTYEEQKKYVTEMEEKRTERKISESEKIDTEAPDFSARSMSGKKFKTKDLKDKILVINFWFVNCPPCKKEIPQLNKLKNEFKGKNVEFIAFALDEEYKIAKFIESNPFDYDIIDDATWAKERYEIEVYPTNIIVDKDGLIAYYKSGYKSDIYESMSYKINKLLK
ncbi:redoxin domain-containing protein [Polaribacter sp.]|nr:redoxin domain-containing protein [Polaribacter sp.]